MITYNRREEAVRSVGRLLALPERPRVVVVDHGSSDGTAAAVRAAHPAAEVIASPVNLGAVGRNVGVRRLDTPYVAFCDDDTRWEPGSLRRAADVLDKHPDVAAHSRMWLGGEEELLAVDLSTAGWEFCYLESLTVHHEASRLRDPSRRRRDGLRNTLWFTWLRRPFRPALRRTLHLAVSVPRDRTSAPAALDALRGAGWVRAERRQVPPAVEVRLASLESSQRLSQARRYVG
ncbi:MAG TPA: glycosyltransferase [Mycobacteriales bacterium]